MVKEVQLAQLVVLNVVYPALALMVDACYYSRPVPAPELASLSGFLELVTLAVVSWQVSRKPIPWVSLEHSHQL